ncbi:MAG TPA: aminotransferase class V-fold PLP-dependent enzyme [Steroidobacteraceae bacterium]|nr:aminotransferase class V-fold PLP-dependent enzyme [Steroidobacteraceae bacterium]
MGFAEHWILDPSVDYLNHGSFGACPRAVLDLQSALREELEREPVDFLVATLPTRLGAAREALAGFLGAAPRDVVFVSNATSAVNAVLRSLRFEPGDELLLTTHTYAACKKTIDFIASRTGLRPVVAALPFPLADEEQVVAAVRAGISPRTRLALMDHVTSPTALVLPIARLVRELDAAGVDTLVDGAHAPGMVPLALSELGAAYYTGNAHKWLCAPKGAAFLHVRRDRQAALHPNVISHGYSAGFQEEFDWTGTFDPTPWLCIPESIRFLASLVPGGWPEIMACNRALALEARDLLLEVCGLAAPCPDEMLGSMASIPLPKPAPGSAAEHLDFQGLHDWFRARSVETWLHPHPRSLIRVSAQIYNDRGQFVRLAQLLGEALHGG